VAGCTTKAVNASALRHPRNGSAPGPLSVRQLKNREDFRIVIDLARYGINGLDFIGTQDEAISRQESKHTDVSANSYVSRRIPNRVIIQRNRN
jgi:hypothetical protein